MLVEANPKLNSIPAPKDKEFLNPEILTTFFDSNMLQAVERITAEQESKWLVKVLSDVSKKDMGHLLSSASAMYETSETMPVEVFASPAPAGASVEAGQPEAQAGESAPVASQPTLERPTYQFTVEAKKTYLEIVCEEMRAIDQHLPLVADAEDSLGLCLMDMQRPDLAIGHFRESERIRESYPELHAQVLQTRLFIANCLMRQGNHAESKRALAQVRADLTANSQTLDANSIEHLNKNADLIEAGKASP
jgi:hypothetical protein